MSHWTKIDFAITSIPALKQACTELGLDFVEGKDGRKVTARGYGNQPISCDHVIRLKDSPYDVAIVKDSKTGAFNIQADFWQGHVQKHIGQNGNTLKQRYSVCAVQLQARRRGYSVTSAPLKDGKIKMTVRVP